MNKIKILLACVLLGGSACIKAAGVETATEAVKNMGLGWNLGNALEANSQRVTDVNNAAFWGQQDLSSETCWGQYFTQPGLMKMMKDAGFGAIRVPVTWYNHMDESGKVDEAWMARVKEIVDYVTGQGLYCIINVHHDTGADSYSESATLTGYHWIKADESNYNANKSKFEYLWQQIAETFKDYDGHLLFEGYNEMLDANSCWNYPSWHPTNAYNATYAAKSLEAVNNYAQSFVNTVRKTGGNNADRNLIVCTYAAAAGGNWGHADEVVNQMKRPEDTTDGHLIFEVHNYPNIEGDYKATVDYFFDNLTGKLAAKGCPVIIGEWGTSNVDKSGQTDYDVRRDKMFEFCDYFIAKAKANNIATFYWMGLSDGAARLFPAFNQPDLAKRLLQAYHGSSYNPTLPERSDFGSIACTVDFNQQYAEFNLVQGSFTSNDYIRVMLELEEAPASGLFQWNIYGTKNSTKAITAAKSNLSVTADMGTITRVTLQCLKPSGSARIKSIKLKKQSGAEVACDPSVFWGCTMRDVTVSETTGISSIGDDARQTDDKEYDLLGRQAQVRKGIAIKGGRKYLLK